MAHFAEIDTNGIVKQVIVVNNTVLIGNDGAESEQRGAEFCRSLFGGTWVQTSYNGKFRGAFAGVGYTYDKASDTFVSPMQAPRVAPPSEAAYFPNGNVSL